MLRDRKLNMKSRAKFTYFLIILCGTISLEAGFETIHDPDCEMKVYVSPEGSEGGAGTLDDPLGNLEQARDVVRAYLRREGSG